MSVKGKCPNCGKIIELDEHKETNVCPFCEKEYSTVEANKIFNMEVYKILHTANMYLFNNKQYDKAFEIYDELYHMDEDNMEMVFGRQLAFMHLSTLREPKFKETVDYINDSTPNFEIKPDNDFPISEFINNFLKCLDFYLTNAFSRILVDDEFIDKDCENLYFKIIDNVLVAYNWIKEIYLSFVEDDRYLIDKNEDELNEIIKHLELEKNKQYKVKEDSMYSLFNDEKELIDDVIFKDAIFKTKVTRTLIYCMAACIVGLIPGVILLFQTGTLQVVGIVLCVIFACLFLGMYITVNVLRKK